MQTGKEAPGISHTQQGMGIVSLRIGKVSRVEVDGEQMRVLSPIYNSSHSLTPRSNRLWALNLGLTGNPTDELAYRLRLTYSRNWGSYHIPLPEVEDCFSMLAEIKWRPQSIRALRGWEGSLSIGADGGDMPGNSFGMRLSVSRTGLIRF